MLVVLLRNILDQLGVLGLILVLGHELLDDGLLVLLGGILVSCFLFALVDILTTSSFSSNA